MTIKKDCFACREISETKACCDGLNEMNCDGCNFYKNKEFYEQELIRCDMRNVQTGAGEKYKNVQIKERKGRWRGSGKKNAV